MNLDSILYVGYTIMILSIVWMLWLTYTSASTVCQFDSYCTCSRSPPLLGQVVCSDARVSLNSLNTSQLFSLTLNNNGLNTLAPNLFQRTGLSKLEISNNPIYYMHDESLLGLESSLKELHVTDGKLFIIPGNAIRHLNKLKVLNLTGNLITKVSFEPLKGVANSLEDLILANNRISQLPSGVFSILTQLEFLDLHGNGILSLEPSVFTPAPPKLKKLDVSDNLLENLPFKQFGNLRMLQSLNLNKNQLTVINDPASRVKLSLDSLLLEYNRIAVLPPNSMANFDIANETSFKGNPLNVIEPNAFFGCRISELILANCQLSEITSESLNGLENTLQYLDLSGNNFTSFMFLLLQRYNGLKTLNLDYNRMVDFKWMGSVDDFQDSHLIELHLSGKGNRFLPLTKIPKLGHLQSLTVSTLESPNIQPVYFEPYSVELETVKITDSNLKSLDAKIFQHVRGIKTLDLTDNSIDKIDSKCLSEVAHSLENLILTHSLDSRLTSLPKGFLKQLKALKVLKINHNQLIKFPREIQFLMDLEIFHAHDNNLDAVLRGVFKSETHQNLKEINLSFNKITKIISHTFVELNNLVEINLSDNNIINIEFGSFVNLYNLNAIHLRGNKLQFLHSDIFQDLPHLSLLDVAYNAIVYFNFACLDQVASLSSLTLNASHNMMNFLEGNATIGGKYSVFTYVKVLDLSYNNISSIHKSFFEPVQHSLSQLHLSHNVLTNATRDIFPEMPNLQLLDLSHNAMTEIEFDSFRRVKSLQVVDLSNNMLSAIPIGLFQFSTVVRKIDMSSNQIVLLMESIISSPSLTSVNFSNNKLNRVPLNAFSPSSASNLEELYVANNKITTLPNHESFSRFNKLVLLDISSNKITNIGNSFKSLYCLSKLNLANNPVEINSGDFAGLEKTLEHLDISNVSLGYVPPMPLPTLLSLNMAYNLIMHLPYDFQTNLTSLKKLDISFNSLTTMPSLPQLKILNIAGNQIGAISNMSFAEIPNLIELDIRELHLSSFDIDSLGTLQYLHTLRTSNYHHFTGFNVPMFVKDNRGLRSIHFEADSVNYIATELSGFFPVKVNHLIISGKQLKSLPDNLLKGVQSSPFKLTVKGTIIETLQKPLFSKNLRSIIVDVADAKIKSMANPSNTAGPDRPKTTFLIDLFLGGDNWNCDCKIGWIETWQRKRRQKDQHDHSIEESRSSKCKNKRYKPILDVLKSEVECGWSDARSISCNLILVGFLVIMARLHWIS